MTRSSPRKPIVIVALTVVGVLMPLLCCSGFLFWFAVGPFSWIGTPTGFYDNPGVYDHYRIPLREPYVITTIDSLDNPGRLYMPGGAIEGVVRFHFAHPFILGERGPSRVTTASMLKKWFIVDMRSEAVAIYGSYDEYEAACAALGLEEPPLLTDLRTNYEAYWGQE